MGSCSRTHVLEHHRRMRQGWGGNTVPPQKKKKKKKLSNVIFRAEFGSVRVDFGRDLFCFVLFYLFFCLGQNKLFCRN